MKDQSAILQAAENSRTTLPAFLYFLSYEGGATYFWTGFDQDFTVVGSTRFSDPQVFTSCQINHTPPVEETETRSQGVTVSLAATDTELRKYLITAPSKQIDIEIYRVNMANGFTGEVNFDDLYMEFKGTATSIAFKGYVISASFLPPVLHEDRQVPAFFYQKTCNHQLGNKFCTVDLTPWATTITVAAVNRVDKTIDFTNHTFANAVTITDESFTGGKLTDASGNRVGILIGEANVGAGTRIWLNWWPGINVGDTIVVSPGCLKIPRACIGFNNFANFGGTPCIPATNPVTNGVIS